MYTSPTDIVGRYGFCFCVSKYAQLVILNKCVFFGLLWPQEGRQWKYVKKKQMNKECRQQSPMTDLDNVNSTAMTVNLHTCEM